MNFMQVVVQQFSDQVCRKKLLFATDKLLFFSFLFHLSTCLFFVVVFEAQDIISLECLESKSNFLDFLFLLAIIQEASSFSLLNPHVYNKLTACIAIIYFLAVTIKIKINVCHYVTAASTIWEPFNQLHQFVSPAIQRV